MDNLKELIKDIGLDESAFTDDVQSKLAVLMETQLAKAKDSIETSLTEELTEKYDQEALEYKEFLNSTLDEYLTKWTDEYVEKNEENIYESVQVKTAEKVLKTFKSLVEDFNIQVNDEVIEESIELDDLKESYNDAVNENIDLKKEIEGIKVQGLIENYAADFDIESKKEKFKTLAEGLYFNDEESFSEKLEILSETVGTSVEKEVVEEELSESEVEENQKIIVESVEKVKSENSEMLKYL